MHVLPTLPLCVSGDSLSLTPHVLHTPPPGVSVARMLVDKGDIVLIADSQGIRDIYSADGNALDPTTPLLVLVNKGTASASEVGGGGASTHSSSTLVAWRYAVATSRAALEIVLLLSGVVLIGVGVPVLLSVLETCSSW